MGIANSNLRDNGCCWCMIIENGGTISTNCSSFHPLCHGICGSFKMRFHQGFKKLVLVLHPYTKVWKIGSRPIAYTKVSILKILGHLITNHQHLFHDWYTCHDTFSHLSTCAMIYSCDVQKYFFVPKKKRKVHNFNSTNMTCKHAQSIFVGEKYVKINYLKQFLRGWRDEHNIIIVQLFAHQKKENAQFCSIHSPCKILVAKFSATFLKNKICATKFHEHEMQKIHSQFWKECSWEKIKKGSSSISLEHYVFTIQRWAVCKRFCHVLVTFRNCFLCSPKASWEIHCASYRVIGLLLIFEAYHN
jgi:hypothetical protein